MKVAGILQVLQGLGALQGELAAHDERLSAGLAFKLARINRQLAAERGVYEEQRVALVKEYGEADEEGNWKVADENLEQFNKEHRELLDTEVKLEVDPVPVSEFDRPVSLQVMAMLLPIVEDE
jgi:hypothetical protein